MKTILTTVFIFCVSAFTAHAHPSLRQAQGRQCRTREKLVSPQGDTAHREVQSTFHPTAHGQHTAVVIEPTLLVENNIGPCPLHETEDENEMGEEQREQKRELFLKKKKRTPSINEPSNGKYEQTLQVPPTVLSGFDAQPMVGGTPPDNSMAISNSGTIVSADNGHIAFYTSAGTQLGSYTYPTWFQSSVTMWADPRVLYDATADRFIFVIQSGVTSNTSFVNVCFSSSNDPMSAWYVYTFDSEYTNAGYWFDYPNVALSTSELFVSGNCPQPFTSGNIIYQIDKAQGYAGQNINYAYYLDVTDGTSYPANTIVPVGYGQAGTYGNALYFVANDKRTFNTQDKVYLFRVSGTQYSNPSITRVADITVPAFDAPADAVQMGSGVGLDAGYCNIKSVFYLGGIIHYVYVADDGAGYGNIKYGRLNTANYTVTFATIGATNTDYNYPSIASMGINSTDHSVVITFTKSDGSTYPEVRWKYYDSSMQPIASSTLRAGNNYVVSGYQLTSNGSERWGDYTTMQRRYNTSTYPTVWCAGSYANANKKWQCHIGEIGYFNPNTVVDETDSDAQVNIYPNPSEGIFTITCALENYTVRVTDMVGRMVMEEQNAKQIDLSAMPCGMYVVSVGGVRMVVVKQ